MIYVYAIKSFTRHYIYVGMTNDIDRRLTEHNNGENRSTKAYKPFMLIYPGLQFIGFINFFRKVGLQPFATLHLRPCPGGEIGRRTVFRSQRSQGCAGSNPFLGTTKKALQQCKAFFITTLPGFRILSAVSNNPLLSLPP